MKNRKVLNLRTHVAGVLGQNSYDSNKHGADMELTAVGVLIKSVRGRPGCNVLAPFGNVIEAILAPEAEEDAPRVGRPPKVVA